MLAEPQAGGADHGAGTAAHDIDNAAWNVSLLWGLLAWLCSCCMHLREEVDFAIHKCVPAAANLYEAVLQMSQSEKQTAKAG